MSQYSQVQQVRVSTLVAALAMLMSSAHADAPTIDLAHSTVTATFRQMGVSVDASFKRMSGVVQFDPAMAEAAKTVIEIETASFDLGDPMYNAEVAKKDWFDSAHFPKASFASTSVRATGAGKFEATGKLTIKGKTVDVVVPFLARGESAGSVYEGALPIKRLTFNIGEGEWKDTSLVADEVTIKFRIAQASPAVAKK
jgi:polyisoprenoid-binding protein YceI